MKLGTLKATLLGGVLAVMTAGAAMAEPEIKLVFGVAGQPTWGFGKLLTEVIEPNLEKYSEGRIDLEVHQRGALCSEAACMEQLGLGQIDMTTVSAGNLGTFGKTFDILNLPYLFKNQEEAEKIMRGWLGEELAKQAAEEMGIHVLATVSSGGFRNLVNTEREVHVPADLEGLKIRVTKSPTEFNLVKGWGAVPIPYAWASLYEGLQSGVVQGMYLQDVFVAAAKFYEVAKYVAKVESSYSGRPVMMSKQRYDDLPDWARDAIDKVAADIADQALAYDLAWQEEAIGTMKDKVSIYVPTDAELAEWQKGAIDAWVAVKGNYDPALARRILEEQGRTDLIALLEQAGAL
ncbi:MAG: TRAP transporter substrate-binding protein [Rhizobiaceae bacterium]